MHSENLETLFVTTESGGLDYIHENKQHEEAGELSAVTADGIIEYEGKLKRFSGRGNSTFRAPKKSYSFTLENGQELCGLEYGKKWNLLSLYYEQDKIHSKIVYDMAKASLFHFCNFFAVILLCTEGDKPAGGSIYALSAFCDFLPRLIVCL